MNAFVRETWDGNVEGMVIAFTNVPDVNGLGIIGHTTATALYFASYQGKLEAVRWLLRQEGIDVNLGSTYGTSPLCIASTHGYKAVVEALITAGADVNHPICWGFTALMGASARGRTAIVRRLIAAGAHANKDSGIPIGIIPGSGSTALDHAHWYHHSATVEVLLEHRAMPSITPSALFALYAKKAKPEVLARTDVFGRTALHYAALRGDRKGYAMLYSAMRAAGVDTEGVDGGGYTALNHLVRVYVCVWF
jgi:ankyrin repeat protein